MKYMMCFFPWIGAVIGSLMYLWYGVAAHFELGIFGYTCVAAAIPVLVTGGFHVVGYMDSMDAFHSYQPRERKLEILKDPHIGAFSVIMLALYGLIFLGALSEVHDADLTRIVCIGFFLARTLSGIGVVNFKSAKHDGLPFTFASGSHKAAVRGILYVQCALAVVLMLMQSVTDGCLVASTAFCVFGYYYWKCKKELGGITGDTAGFFLSVCELCMIVMAAVINVIR